MILSTSEELGPAQALSLLRRSYIWADAEDGICRALLQRARFVSGPPGDLVLRRSDAATDMVLLVQGLVRVFYEQAGQQVTVKLFPAPNVFGDPEAVHTGHWQESVDALSAYTVIKVPAAHYLACLRRSNGALFRQYLGVCRQFAVAIQSDIAANFFSPFERLVTLLLAYAEAIGEPEAGGVIFRLPISQDSLASQIGSNRRTLVRLFEPLYKDGLLLRRGRRLVVPDVAALRGAVGGNIAQLCLPLVRAASEPVR
jgi:CRP-like cAMP-binding protein